MRLTTLHVRRAGIAIDLRAVTPAHSLNQLRLLRDLPLAATCTAKPVNLSPHRFRGIPLLNTSLHLSTPLSTRGLSTDPSRNRHRRQRSFTRLQIIGADNLLPGVAIGVAADTAAAAVGTFD